jgi:hypothetical protein
MSRYSKSIYDVVRLILDKHGIVGPYRVAYYGFALKLLRIVRTMKGDDMVKVIKGLRDYYGVLLKINPDEVEKTLDDIVKAVLDYASKESKGT